MDLLNSLAEQKIGESINAGDLENLEGAGKPIDFTLDEHVPTEVRAIYRVLKHANVLPPEVQLRQDLVRVETLMQSIQNDAEKDTLGRALKRAQLKLALLSQQGLVLQKEQAYVESVVQHLKDT